jgi:hypothetical protein
MVYSAFTVDQMRDFRTELRGLPVVATATAERTLPPHGSYRGPEDDFYCHRFEVWYSSLDCAIRTQYSTCASCANCDQGRFNAKRHGSTLRQARIPICDA